MIRILRRGRHGGGDRAGSAGAADGASLPAHYPGIGGATGPRCCFGHQHELAALARGRWPRHVVGMNVSTQAAKLREDFAFLDDWEARFAHLIDLGKALPQLAPHEYDDINKVRGCSSQVWLVAAPSPARPGAIRFRGASDAMIVSGLVAMLLQLFSDQPPADILAFDAEGFFRDIGVADALTPQRSNGLKSMLARIRAIAEAAQ